MLKQFSIDAPDFNLAHTLECGQVFRWNKLGENEYEGVVADSIIITRQDKDRLFIQTSNPHIGPPFINSYFDLPLDLAYIYNKIGKDKHIKTAIKRFEGLRIVRQPLWECIASFIISAYNNIPRIKGIICELSRCAGARLKLGERINYSFPRPQFFADTGTGQLRQCGTGFRAPYLKKAAGFLLNGKLDSDSLRKNPLEKARETLMQLDGVGQKVADCVLLYSIGRFEAFPVDVWIKRVMERLYFGGKNTTEARIREFAKGYFGAYAGYAQQYLYHWARTAGKT